MVQKSGNLSANITLLSFVVVADNRWQLLSGVEHTELEIERYEGETNLINSLVDEEESVLIIERGSNGIMTAKLGYYCLPRKIDFSSPGLLFMTEISGVRI